MFSVDFFIIRYLLSVFGRAFYHASFDDCFESYFLIVRSLSSVFGRAF